MSSDNVTPFRRRPPPPKPAFNPKEPRELARAIYVLAAGGLALLWFGGLISLLGVALSMAAVFIAAGNRGEGPPWAQSHFEFVLRTIVIAGCALMLLSLVQTLPLVGVVAVWLRLVVFVWAGVRLVVGFVRAIRAKPNAYARGWLI
jgi:uncharacterized membrane protein